MGVKNDQCAICGKEATIHLSNTGEAYCASCINQVLSDPVLRKQRANIGRGGERRLVQDGWSIYVIDEAQSSQKIDAFDHTVGSPILDLEVRLDALSKQLADSPDTSNLMAAKQELIFKTKQLDLNPPETQKWVKWFINQTEKHEQGTIANHSYLNMIQSYKKFLSDLSV